jgi:hypothetical protein
MKTSAKLYEIWGNLESRNIDANRGDVENILKIRRLALRHHRLAEMDCNGEGVVNGKFYRCDGSIPSSYLPDGETTVFTAASDKLELKMKILCDFIQNATIEFQGDPRGATVQMTVDGHSITDLLY